MSQIFTNRQRAAQYRVKGQPTLALEFDAYSSGEVSMWAHTRHEVPFEEMKAAFEAIRRHLASFLADEAMCPFNPKFLKYASNDPPEIVEVD